MGTPRPGRRLSEAQDRRSGRVRTSNVRNNDLTWQDNLHLIVRSVGVFCSDLAAKKKFYVAEMRLVKIDTK